MAFSALPHAMLSQEPVLRESAVNLPGCKESDTMSRADRGCGPRAAAPVEGNYCCPLASGSEAGAVMLPLLACCGGGVGMRG